MKILEQILEEIEKEIQIEKAVWDSLEKPPYNEFEQCLWVAGMRNAKDIIRSHMEDDGWIPVDGGNFPPNLKDKLLQTDDGNMYVGWYNRELLEFETEDFMFGGAYGKVVAWRPLPEPYRPKEG